MAEVWNDLIFWFSLGIQASFLKVRPIVACVVSLAEAVSKLWLQVIMIPIYMCV